MERRFECFKSWFSILQLEIAFHLALWYLTGKGKSEYQVSKELYASKRFIIKAHRKQGSVRSYIYFSVHKRVKTNSHGGVYSWYFEKYEIFHHKETDKVRYRINNYGHYPYDWE